MTLRSCLHRLYSSQTSTLTITSILLVVAGSGCSASFNRPGTLSSLSALSGNQCTGFKLNKNGMTSWWNDDLISASQISDSNTQLIDIGGSHPGSLFNLATPASGKVNNALSFYTTQSYVSIPHHSDYNFTDQITALAWVKSDLSNSSSASRTLISKSSRSFPLQSSQFSFKTPSTIYSTAKGLHSAAFDGRYVYFVPSSQPTKFLRYDTYSPEPFSSSSALSWEYFDISTLGLSITGRTGAVFDGRYVYFQGSSTNTVIVRYDTQSGEKFSEATLKSWGKIDLASSSLGGASAKGFHAGPCFDGKYVYFVPNNSTTGSNPASLMARFDSRSQEDFSTSTLASWSFLDLSQSSVGGTSAANFAGCIYDGKYIYLMQMQAGKRIGRYDTKSSEEFSASTSKSWSFFDMATLNANANLQFGGVFDGRYIYISPNQGSSQHIVSRYDTRNTDNFNSSNAWSFFKPSTLYSTATQFDGAIFDGRYVYFVPRHATSPTLTRYDTLSTESFASSTAKSWSFMSLKTLDSTAQGYLGASFDGRYLYLVPYNSGNAAPVVRVDTVQENSSFGLKASHMSGDGRSNSPSGPAFHITTDQGHFQIASPQLLDENWHLLAGVYNGETLSLYVDGVLKASRSASGNMAQTSAPLNLGGDDQGNLGLGGSLDEARIYQRALASDELSTIYSLDSSTMCKE